MAFGRACGEAALAGEILALDGDLGAGKTHFVKGFLQGVGFPDEVTSPTFTLVHEYRGGRLPVFHFDFYRLTTPEEVLGVGFDDYLDEGGIMLVEWASKFPAVFPAKTRWMRFEIGEGDGRRIVEGTP